MQVPPSAAPYVDVKSLVSAFFGGVLAIVGQYFFNKAAKAWTAKRLALAFGEELKTVDFFGATDFAGFSSQTFDALFTDLAKSLPERLAKDLMRYHWLMKYLNESKATGTTKQDLWIEAKGLREDLIGRCEAYKRRKVPTLMFWPYEKRSRPRPAA